MLPINTPSTGESGLVTRRELRQALSAIVRMRMTARHPLKLSEGPIGSELSIVGKDSMWVRITGHLVEAGESGSGSGETLPSDYSGVQQTDEPGIEGVIDQPSGVLFYADTRPLREVLGNANVPDNSIVRAFPNSRDGGYSFLYAPGQVPQESGSGGCDNCGIRVSDLIRCVDGQLFDGCLVIRNGCIALLDPDTGEIVAGGGMHGAYDEESDPPPPPP